MIDYGLQELVELETALEKLQADNEWWLKSTIASNLNHKCPKNLAAQEVMCNG